MTIRDTQDAVLVPRNDYSVLSVPQIGRWTPTLTVSIIIPAHGHQDKLDLVLAALTAQTYPAELTEIVIVDDSTTPPLQLPPIRPPNTRIITPQAPGWGSAHAVNTGATHTTGTILMRLDADMLTWHHHIESQMRWHHQTDYTTTIGHKKFVHHTPHNLTPEQVHAAVAAGQAHTLFTESDPHWIESIIARTNGLRDENHTAYRVFVGASGAMHRSLFNAAGGMDPHMILGGDTEFGYRLAQAGAVFIPDHESSSWHLGRTQIQSRRDVAKRYRKPFLANRIPELHYRDAPHRHQWNVPFVDVVVDVTKASLEETQGVIGPLLGSHSRDIRVTLVADWPDSTGRHATLDDPLADHRLIKETYRGEPRVRFSDAAPPADPLVPFRLLLPATAQTTGRCVDALTTAANEHQAGLLEVALPDGSTVRLERHAAFARARHLGGDGAEQLDAIVARSFGAHHVDAASASVEDAALVNSLSTIRYRHDGDREPRLEPARRDLAEARQELAVAKRRMKRQRRRISRLKRTPLWRARRLADRWAKRLLPGRVYGLARRITSP